MHVVTQRFFFFFFCFYYCFCLVLLVFWTAELHQNRGRLDINRLRGIFQADVTEARVPGGGAESGTACSVAGHLSLATPRPSLPLSPESLNPPRTSEVLARHQNVTRPEREAASLEEQQLPTGEPGPMGHLEAISHDPAIPKIITTFSPLA